MQDISEYSANTSDYELCSFFYDRIISGEIKTFSALTASASAITNNRRSHPVIMKAFELIKCLYWGFFSSISPKTHPKLWNEVVITDKNFPEAGDLKQTLQISNLYIGMLDIHGYTKFCMETRKNLSMMHTLDRAMEIEIGAISAACDAISHRERGDEIVVVAASATNIVTAVLAIIDYFGKSNIVGDSRIVTKRSSEADALPAFKVSAGITGGNTTSPLIITDKGGLSGFLLNSGARLQARANELSPKESRIMIAKQVQMNFDKENAQFKCTLAENNTVYFFDTGHIEFKGVIIPTCEIVFMESERYKEKFAPEMNRLMESIDQNLWEQRIFADILALIIKAATVMPAFSVTPQVMIDNIQTLTNDSLVHLGKKAMAAYLREEDYNLAVTLLKDFVEIVEMIPSFDRLIFDYLRGISAKYTMLLDMYNENIDRQIEEKASGIFLSNYATAWAAAKKGVSMHAKLCEMGKNSELVAKKKNLWCFLIKQNQKELEFSMYAGKK
ncbi:MAG: hypothetical protein LBC52_06330 [Treponema sp.]|jgi:hypothetical protein|nr:hypothetical protein [Treponema sp.]